MTLNVSPSPDDVSAELRRVLNRHGYGLQYSVLEACDGTRFTGTHSGTWRLLKAEVPVVLNGKDFHIDGVLEFIGDGLPTRLLAVVECKKVNPAFGRWCFAAAHKQPEPLLTDVYWAVGTELRAQAALVDPHGTPISDVAVELKSQTKGEGKGKGAFDEASAQALRGVGGLAERIGEWGDIAVPTRIVPLIVSTAQLFWTPTPLDSADLQTGELGPDLEARPYSWLWHRATPNRPLLPRVERHYRQPPEEGANRIGRAVAHEHQRAVAVANVDGLTEALWAIAMQTPHRM